jgi:hypothetical protein
LRISWVWASGTKLARIRPYANSSASHIASLMSVLRLDAGQGGNERRERGDARQQPP